MLAVNSILHFLIDGICAYAMYGMHGDKWIYSYLFYNLCAFALQMPFGAVVDLVCTKLPTESLIIRKRFYWCVEILGIVFTLAGIFLGPFALGVGNALFHIGGGVFSISEDEERKLKGRGLGIFVAPGAVGLFLGVTLSDFTVLYTYINIAWVVLCAVLIIIGFYVLSYEENHLIFVKVEDKSSEAVLKPTSDEKVADTGMSSRAAMFNVWDILLPCLGCFIVVIIRSYTGFEVYMPWKSGFWLPLLATLAVALGKVMGGFLSALVGEFKTVCGSMALAAVLFAFAKYPVCGLLALLFFNMSMPITLYIMVRTLKTLPGLAFGIPTFALFIGFALTYFNVRFESLIPYVGILGSIISLVVLILMVYIKQISRIKSRI